MLLLHLSIEFKGKNIPNQLVTWELGWWCADLGSAAAVLRKGSTGSPQASSYVSELVDVFCKVTGVPSERTASQRDFQELQNFAKKHEALNTFKLKSFNKIFIALL